MMVARAFFSFTAAILVGLGAAIPDANATPPTIIDIREEPFGLSSTHLFVIRSSADNLGLYESMRAESFLVAIDLATGAEEIWLLDRVTTVRDYAEDGSQLDFVTTRDEGLVAVNPYAVLAERGAVPWSAVSLDGTTILPPEIARDPEVDAITVTYAHGPAYRLTAGELSGAIERLSASMARNVADRTRMSRMSTRAVFAERFVAIERCKPDGMLEYWTIDRESQARLLRITCGAQDDEGVTSLIVQLNPVSPQAAAH